MKMLALDHSRLASLPSLTYVSSFVHCVSKMRIEDEAVWASLASYLAERHDQFDARNLSTVTYALANISRLKPIILNFDDLFRKFELSIIKKFDQDSKLDGQAIANAVLSYSKTQNGSVEFFRAIEGVVLANYQLMSPQELSNVLYSFQKSENAVPDVLLEQLEDYVVENLARYKPIELC